jgi:hypothetical protein
MASLSLSQVYHLASQFTFCAHSTTEQSHEIDKEEFNLVYFPKQKFVKDIYIYITLTFLGYQVPTLVEMITRCLGWKVHLILQLAAVSALCVG